MEIRKLNAGDLHKLLEIAGKLASDSLIEIMRSEQKVNEIQAGFAFVSAALKYANKDIKELLCSLAGLKLTEYEQQAFDFPIQVIEKVAEQEDINKVFLRVKGLMKIFGLKS